MTTAASRFTSRPATTEPPDPLGEQLRTLGLYVMAERYGVLAEEARKAKSPYSQYLAALDEMRAEFRKDRPGRESRPPERREEPKRP